jgi:RNA polymerase primary sigma factor
MHDKIVMVFRAIQKLEKQLCRQPTTIEIAKELSWKEDEVKKVMKSEPKIISISGSNPDDEERSLLEYVADESLLEIEDITEVRLLQEAVIAYINTLPEKERMVISLRLGLNGNKSFSLEEIGHMRHVTRERIRQIEAKALKKIRQEKIFREYFE